MDVRANAMEAYSIIFTDGANGGIDGALHHDCSSLGTKNDSSCCDRKNVGVGMNKVSNGGFSFKYNGRKGSNDDSCLCNKKSCEY